MLLHDSYFHSSNKSINTTHYGTIVVAYSPLFHSTFTLIISIFGVIFNFICCIKLWFILYQYKQRKLNNTHEQEFIHVLAHNKYRFLIALTSNDCLLCLSSIISCLDEKYFFQALLARHHLCAAHILLWKFTLHFIPLLTIGILCRYHYILNKAFQVRSSNLSTLNQLLCTDLNILIAFVLALAWSVDGLWLWGVANIKDFIKPPLQSSVEHTYSNGTMENLVTSSTNNSVINTTLLHLNRTRIENNDGLFLSEQTRICYLQTNHNFEFSLRLIHLIEADFLLLFAFHLSGFVLEICLHIRLCCCIIIKKVTLAFNHERQLCIYILYIFIVITLTSLPFYLYRTLEIIFDAQLASVNNDLVNSRTFAQILLIGSCFKPVLVFILFFPSSILFYLKCYLKCYSPANIGLSEQHEDLLPSSTDPNQEQQRLPNSRSQHHRFSLFTHSSQDLRFSPKVRTHSNPALIIPFHCQNSSSKHEQLTN
ncbi:unnamed protein product [Adineta steineri]|uniref:Uncharacterized protein n=1 Tax=Adineta steineri TaxID=433720 RepID=A0A818MF87_9BILA|nr:unnamed protein product [Adineta steineri]CAF3581639.1 unnamed protein product [Adineta steineri]